MDAARWVDEGPDLPAFARSFAQRAPRFAWFLGAGASAQSFVPTADQLVDVLLRQIYCSERGLPVDSVDLASRHELRRLHETYSGQQGLPHDEDPHFYSDVFERAFASAQDRATFIEEQVRDASPNYGHQVLAALVATNSLRLIATSNFDPLIERAINPVLDREFFDGRQLEIADLDNASRAARALATDRWPLLVKVHGDYRSERLKNVSAELQSQDAELRQAMTSALTRFGLVVVGYSGRDDSVMSMFRDVLALPTPYPAGLVWVRRPQDELAPSVMALLTEARSAGVETSVVTASSFVDFATKIELAMALPPPARQWLSGWVPKSLRRAEPASTGPTGRAPVLRLNALRVDQFPSDARALEWSLNAVQLDRLREALRGPERDALVGLVAGAPAAFGRDSSLRALTEVGVRITDGRRRLELGTSTPGDVDTQALGLAMDALVLGLARQLGLGPVLRSRRPHLLRVLRPDSPALSRLSRACRGQLRGTLHDRASGLRLPWAEAISVNLERRGDQWWLLLNPEIWMRREPLPREEGGPPPTGRELDTLFDQRAQFIRERTASRYNRHVAEILTAWMDLLTGGQRAEIRTFDLQPGEGVDATFVLDGTPAASLPLARAGGIH